MTDFHGHRSEDERMRRLFDDAVAGVEPRDTLEEIRMRTTTPPRRRSPWVLGAAGAALATAATVAAVALMSDTGGTTDEGPGFAGSPTATSGAETSGPTTSAEPEPEPSETAEAAEGAVTVPVYFLGETPRGARLYREFHRVTVAQDERIAAAAAAALAEPKDPDYRSGWPDGLGIGSATLQDDVITVDVTTPGADPAAVRSRPEGTTGQEASLALDQMIYTVQAAAQQGRPGVQFLLDGERTNTLLGEPVNEPLAESDQADVQALVWVIEPADGAEVSAPFQVSGVANAFEANVQWELVQGDRVVKEGFTTAAEAFTFAEYSFTVENVPPGEYTLVVHDSDPSGGAEGGGGVTKDTKRITVR